MRDNYPNCIPIIRHNEGGFADAPHDPGGATMAGVTQRTYDAYRRKNGRPEQSVKLISEQEIADIYREYWASDQIPNGLDLMQFDASVNSGFQQGIRWLQEAVGASVDGIMGPETVRAAAASDAHVAIEKAAKLRLEFLQSLTTWQYFGHGWANRIAYTKTQALGMVQ